MNAPPAWQALHDAAVERGERHYIDPETGYVVFTELQHLDRGTCCGSACRHCPYEHENVPENRRKPQILR
ncbi:DUF5522 domain-containing protein [Erythrobacter sp.]|jgi:hypothetical protein|uniref:DUF5522 domain-containing protein n=1 Tax=Erythrobacter sp. TaxID=1042 RepID=UPI002EB3624B|nr:DUF5522 domain-containing protein [Erythrobacter sp.]